MNRAWIWGGFLSLADFSRDVLQNLMDVTKDFSDIVAYYHLGIFDNSEFFIDHTRRSGGLQAENCSTILVFTAGFGVSPSGGGDGLYSWHFLNPAAPIHRGYT
jgi:hypothetical protein